MPLVTRLKRLSDARRVTPINRERDLVTDMNQQEDMDFWNSLVIAKSDFSYEPIGLAGSAVSGNRTSNMNRFGVSINGMGKSAGSNFTDDSSVKTVTSKSSGLEKTSATTTATSSSSSRSRQRTFALGNHPKRSVMMTRSNSESELEPSPRHLIVPPELLCK